MRSPLTAELFSNPPALHGEGSQYWGLAWPALAWLEETVQEGMATLETGAGSSTMMFAACGAEHEAVTPSADEAERIKTECERRGIPTDKLRFQIGSSHEVLPAWEARPLDLVLVDGAHGFPYPILDWWYLAPHVKVGGRMLLDDAYMAPVSVLVDYLKSRDSWRVEDTVGYRTVIVRKLADELPEFDWSGERIGRGLSFNYLPPARRARAAVRHRVFSTNAGLAAVRFARRRLGFAFRKR